LSINEEPESKRIHRAAVMLKHRADIARRALKYMDEADDMESVTIAVVPFISSEIVGVDNLRRFAQVLKKSNDKVIHSGAEKFEQLPSDGKGNAIKDEL